MRKLSLSLIVVVLASIVGLGWLINTIYIHSSSDLQKNAQQQEVVLLMNLGKTLDSSEQPTAFVQSWNNHSATKLNLLTLDELPLPPETEQALLSGEAVLLESEAGIESYIYLPNRQLILSTLVSIDDGSRRPFEFVLTLAFYAGITTIILIWIWPLIHHLEALRKTAKKFGQGQLSERADAHRLSYIRDIEVEFNRMADRIESLISDNKLLSRAVSHDLKTPLARLRFGLDALSETEKPELKEKYAARVDRDMQDMESLIDILLQYARLDESHVSLESKELNVTPIIATLIEKQGSSKIDIEFVHEDIPYRLLADTRYFTMLVNNILTNAIRHAESRVDVSLAKNDKVVKLTIEDDGPGIPHSERDQATKPFWRGERSRDKQGHGMGLAIVQRISDWHDADLSIEQSSSLGGAKIVLVFKI